MSVKREAEMSQTQAGRLPLGRPAYNFQLQTDATHTDTRRRTGASTSRAVANGGNPRPTGVGEPADLHSPPRSGVFIAVVAGCRWTPLSSLSDVIPLLAAEVSSRFPIPS